MKIRIVSTHIENDVVNDKPTLVFTDETRTEWVQEQVPSNHGGYITELVFKNKSWYFNPKNKINKHG